MNTELEIALNNFLEVADKYKAHYMLVFDSEDMNMIAQSDMPIEKIQSFIASIMDVNDAMPLDINYN